MAELWINGKAASDFGIFVDGAKTFTTSPKSIEKVSVPGRNGDLSFSNNRFENEELEYPCFARTRLRERYAALMGYILSQDGYLRIEDDQHLGEYRLALFYAATNVKTGPWNRNGHFTLTFDADPRHFLNVGLDPVVMTSANRSITIHNPAEFTAKPLLEVAGHGLLRFGETALTILQHNQGTITIDCETMNAYKGGTNCNQYIERTSGDFPVLPPGATGVTIPSTIARMSITPRWWRIA